MNLRHSLFVISVLISSVFTGESPVIIEHPLDAIVSKGHPATLNCAAKPDNVNITWYKDGQLVTTNKDQVNSHRIILDTGALFLLKVNSGRSGKDGDAGSYHCVARNEFGEATSREGVLKIAMLRDDFRTSPRNVQELSGNKAVLECAPPRGFPEPVVSWRKDDQELKIQDDPRLSLHPDGNLVIDPVEHSDSGTYQCIATNMVGDRLSNPARLSVYEKPAFIQAPKDVTADVGSSVLFDCRVSGEPQPQISWRKKDAQMPVHRAYIAKDNRGLRIDRVQLSDEGEYLCYARNPAGTIEASARLRVQAPPSFKTKPSDQVVSPGGTASFDCVPTGQPAPAFFWSKEGQQSLLFPGHVSADSRTKVSPTGVLTIADVRGEDEGSYVCAAMNPAGSSLTKAALKLSNGGSSLNPPPVIEFGPQNQTLPVGSSAILPCQASGRNPPRISWELNGKVLDSSSDLRYSQHSTGSLHIAELKKSDSGLYICKASNEDGISTWTAALNVEDHNSQIAFARMPDASAFPTAPTQPVVASVSDTEVVLQWKAPSKHGASPITGYILQYFNPESGQTWLNIPDHTSETTYRIKNLSPSRSYVFVVRAENEKGIGPPSPISSVTKTLPSTSGNDNNNLVDVAKRLTEQLIKLEDIKTVNSTAVRLFWKRKKAEDLIDGYYIKWRGPPRAGSDQYVNVSGTNTENFVVTNLLPFTNYEFFVIPYHRDVGGAPSNSMDALTDEAPPSLPPSDVKIRMLNLTTLRISWKPPPTEGINGILKGFLIVVLGNKGSKFNRNITTNERAASVTLFHLVPGMSYKIRVMARTNAGIGISHGTDVVTMNEETLEKHAAQHNNESESFAYGMLRKTWFIILVTVLVWVILLAFGIFICLKCRQGKKTKDRMGPFIKINDGSVHMTQNGLWDTNTYNSEVYNRGPPPYNGPMLQGLHYSHEYTGTLHRPGSEPHYHYAQVAAGPDNPMTTFYGSQFQDDPSPYATTTLIMSAKQPSWMNDTLSRGPALPTNPVPVGPPARYMDTGRKSRTSRSSDRPTGSQKSDSPPHTDVSYVQSSHGSGRRRDMGTLSGRRSPPKQTLMDLIPPPPSNPPPLREDPYDSVSPDTYEANAGRRPTSRNRSAGVRPQRNHHDDDSQRSSLMLDGGTSSEADGECSDSDHPKRKTMPRMGVSASQLQQSNNDITRTGKFKSLQRRQEHL